jgi:alpha-galactosidase
MPSQPLKIVAIGAGSQSFGQGVVVQVLNTAEFSDRQCTLALVDLDETALDCMYRFAQRVKEHLGSKVEITATLDRTQALPGASYVITSVAIKRYPLWEQDFRVPLAYGFKHVLGENGGPGALFHTLRNLELVIPIF